MLKHALSPGRWESIRKRFRLAPPGIRRMEGKTWADLQDSVTVACSIKYSFSLPVSWSCLLIGLVGILILWKETEGVGCVKPWGKKNKGGKGKYDGTLEVPLKVKTSVAWMNWRPKKTNWLHIWVNFLLEESSDNGEGGLPLAWSQKLSSYGGCLHQTRKSPMLGLWFVQLVLRKKGK